jgi:hypothetical protein
MIPDPVHDVLVSIADCPPSVLPGRLQGEDYGMSLGGAVCWRERQPLRKNKLARFVFGHRSTFDID